MVQMKLDSTQIFLLLFTTCVRVVSSTLIRRTSPDCPSENWYLDKTNNRCLLVVSAAMTYQSAAISCRVLGAQLASISNCDNLDAIEKLVTYSLNKTTVSIWSKYHIVQRESRFFISDDRGQIVEGSEIGGTLENNDTMLCISSQFNNGLKRGRTSCAEEHNFMCSHQLKPDNDDRNKISKRGLAALALALGIFLSFLLVAIFEVIRKLRTKEAEPSQNSSTDKVPITKCMLEEDLVITTEKYDSPLPALDFVPQKMRP